MSNGVLPAMSVDPDTAISNQPEVSVTGRARHSVAV